VSYLDQNNRPIKESSIVLGERLAPNFISEFQYGGLEVPADWAGRVTYEIESLHFLGQEGASYLPTPTNPLDRSLPEILVPINF
jgi:hypothetical protein